MWDFCNPFAWILNIPKYSQQGRILILVFMTIYYKASIGFWADKYEKK